MKNKKKIRGQITIFVIIAIIVVVLIGVFLIFINQNSFYSRNINDESYNIIQNCLKQTGEQALTYIGDMGGYSYFPEKTNDYGIPYYFIDNKNLMPSLNVVENEISTFMNERGALCSFIDYPQYKILNKGNISTKTKIYDDKVQLEIKYPLTVEKSNRKINYENFNIEIPARVGILYNASLEYIEGQVESPEGICINCINDIANKYDVKFITYNYDVDTIIFNLYDNYTKINNQSFYVYTFAVKYDVNISNVSV